ncbi:MAG: hypothetical protein FVQ83_02760 [Chloroflexi bacterium]|nr:hypothetical protein [Chloroflexota bacterium]
MTDILTSVLNNPILSRIRRNHGLEHATIHMLTKIKPNRRLMGHSDTGGFWLLGDVPLKDVETASSQALQRLRAGERKLAVHPNCGTNFVTAGVATGLAGALSMIGVGRRGRDKLERLPLAIFAATLALFLAQPLGYRIQQRITTSGDPGGMEIVEIKPGERAGRRAYRVVTRG